MGMNPSEAIAWYGRDQLNASIIERRTRNLMVHEEYKAGRVTHGANVFLEPHDNEGDKTLQLRGRTVLLTR